MEEQQIGQQQAKATISSAITKLSIVQEFCRKTLRKGVDYGSIVGRKQVLFKSGAEKIALLIGVKPEFRTVETVVDYEGSLFHYHYTCTLSKGGEVVAEADGVATSKEKKWNKTPFDYSLINTICKIAQKRAFVAAVLIASCSSEVFTQDLEIE